MNATGSTSKPELVKLCEPGSCKKCEGCSKQSNESFLPPPEHVLSTLEHDGSRRWLKPKLSTGRWWHRRRALAYVLMVVFMAVPHIRVWGKPLIQLDITSREFTILGHTFLPTDTLLLALTMLAAFISIVLITAVTGRAWCGWACPQTVYMEFLFRPIDRLFEGTTGRGGKAKGQMSVGRQVGRFAVYLVLNAILPHTFLAYFVGTEKLSAWILNSTPFAHPAAFAVMAVTTGLLTYDFFFFREQTCLIACPYGRFQSVMLDRSSMIVAYDYNRGEPRKKGKRDASKASASPLGDCVDCAQCVAVCPTGIDIRDGLQMECINCTQCIDACDSVMQKVGLPTGLIRYSSQDALEKKPQKLIRMRTIIYPVILVVILSVLGVALANTYGFDARILRGNGAPFNLVDRGTVTNSFKLHLVNRTDDAQEYELQIVAPVQATVELVDDSMLNIESHKSAMVPFAVRFPSALTYSRGSSEIEMQVTDSSGNERTVNFHILGPRQ